MSTLPSSPDRSEGFATLFDGDLAFLGRLVDPGVLLARSMLAYIFVNEGFNKITEYSDVASWMVHHGTSSALLPLAILTEAAGGLLVLFGLKTRWAALALAGYCLLTAILFHRGDVIEQQKNVAMAGGFLMLALFGAGDWSVDGLRRRLDGSGGRGSANT